MPGRRGSGAKDEWCIETAASVLCTRIRAAGDIHFSLLSLRALRPQFAQQNAEHDRINRLRALWESVCAVRKAQGFTATALSALKFALASAVCPTRVAWAGWAYSLLGPSRQCCERIGVGVVNIVRQAAIGTLAREGPSYFNRVQ